MGKRRLSIYVPVLVASLLATGCGSEHSPSLALLADKNVFQQSPNILNNKIDILWVVDNSGSMAEEQANLTANFSYFVNSFINKGYDFQISVTTTEAYKATFTGNQTWSRFKDGVGATHSGVFTITPSTPNLLNTFLINASQGIAGSGDERAFSSFKAAFENTNNAGFVRPGGYLAVIILSDEDDFSHSNSFYINRDYNYAGLHTVQSYVDYLDQVTGTTGALRRYSVSTIAIIDDACAATQAAFGGIKGVRYMALADATGGIKADLCSPSYAGSLDALQTQIAELSTQFFLSRVPRPETIIVHVNGSLIPESATNGWTFHADSNSIRFHGSAIPNQGANIEVDFDPVTIK